jgi:hypothetical protein
MNNLATFNDEARPEMDDLLHDYFHAELPNPWPTFKAPTVTWLKRPATIWSRYSGRVALAACVALLVGGYLALSGFFVAPDAGTGLQPVTPNVAKKDKGSKVNIEIPPDGPMPMNLDKRK